LRRISECFVYDFAASAGQFGSEVFDDHFAVMLAAYQTFCVAELLFFGFLFFAVGGSSSVRFEEGR
jgi:hypothetical protein